MALASDQERVPTKGVPDYGRGRPLTLGERRDRWLQTALVEDDGQFQAYFLKAPFHELKAELILPAAMAGRYLGGERFLISDTTQLEPWIS